MWRYIYKYKYAPTILDSKRNILLYIYINPTFEGIVRTLLENSKMFKFVYTCIDLRV